MNWKRHLLETVTLVAVAVACASISNLIAARARRLAFVGSFPDALKVPAAAAPAAGPAAGPEPRPSTPAVPSGAAAPAAPAMSPPTPDAGPRVAERPTPVVRP